MKLFLRLIQDHDIKACGGVEVYLHAFLISILDVEEWPVSRLGSKTPWKELRLNLNRMLDWLQSRPVCSENIKTISSSGNRKPVPTH
jgi:hypothetical protein